MPVKTDIVGAWVQKFQRMKKVAHLSEREIEEARQDIRNCFDRSERTEPTEGQ